MSIRDALDAAWETLRWWEQEELAEKLGFHLKVLDGELGAPRPTWATEEVLLDHGVAVVKVPGGGK